MKTVIAGVATLALLAGASGAFAQTTTTTVVHKTNAMGASKTVVHKTDHMGNSKTVIRHANGSKTVVHHHGMYTKKVHTSPNGDKTVVKTIPN